MKSKILMSTALALGLSALNASAWQVTGTVLCPNQNSAAGIKVFISGTSLFALTTAKGAFVITLPDTPASYQVCVDHNTLPTGASVSGCVSISVDNLHQDATANFTLSGSFCGVTPPPGLCWMTGGGTIDKGTSDFISFGGVVNPGCSPTAADGGELNVVEHVAGLHFKGTEIVVTHCDGGPDKAPPVKVNTIDFMGSGTLTGIGGNSFPETAVCFVGHAEDHGEPGAGKDSLYLRVYNCAHPSTILLLISDCPSTPMTVCPEKISTGNIQIHTSGCNK